MKKLIPAFSFALVAFLSQSALAQQAAAQEKGGDAAAGQTKAAMCIGCHSIPGYQASFPEVHKVPMIAGQNEKYIASALAAYKKGDRRHPTMRGIAESLSDQDMSDLAAYFAHLSAPADAPAQPAAPSAAVAELLKKGNCASCHGANFSTPIDPTYPKLAGQHPDYLYVALKEYQTDKNPQVGRNNAIMMGMARPFTHDEAKQLANYLASLPGELKTVPQSRFR